MCQKETWYDWTRTRKLKWVPLLLMRRALRKCLPFDYIFIRRLKKKFLFHCGTPKYFFVWRRCNYDFINICYFTEWNTVSCSRAHMSQNIYSLTSTFVIMDFRSVMLFARTADNINTCILVYCIICRGILHLFYCKINMLSKWKMSVT